MIQYFCIRGTMLYISCDIFALLCIVFSRFTCVVRYCQVFLQTYSLSQLYIVSYCVYSLPWTWVLILARLGNPGRLEYHLSTLVVGAFLISCETELLMCSRSIWLVFYVNWRGFLLVFLCICVSVL